MRGFPCLLDLRHVRHSWRAPRQSFSGTPPIPPFLDDFYVRFFARIRGESQIYRQVNLLERSKSSRDLRPIESNHRSHIGVMPVTKPPERVVVHPLRLSQNIGRLRESHPRPA